MNHQQTGSIVAYLNRGGLLQAMEGQAAVWHDAMGYLGYEDAQAACRTLVTERVGADRWVTPGDVIAAVRKIRSARVAGVTAPAPPTPLDIEQDIDWRRAYIAARADGLADQAAQEVANRKHGIATPDPAAEIEAPTPSLRALVARARNVNTPASA